MYFTSITCLSDTNPPIGLFEPHSPLPRRTTVVTSADTSYSCKIVRVGIRADPLARKIAFCSLTYHHTQGRDRMPTYLCHGFRWHRQSIRILVGYHELMDAASDWILGPATSSAISHQLRELYPFIPDPEPEQEPKPGSGSSAVESQPSVVKLLEEYDTETQEATRPYAYVADYAVKVDLGVSVTEEMARYDERTPKGQEEEAPWLEKLRDGMQKDEEIQWYIVVCADEERHVPDRDDDQ